jgi:hypothetical protein
MMLLLENHACVPLTLPTLICCVFIANIREVLLKTRFSSCMTWMVEIKNIIKSCTYLSSLFFQEFKRKHWYFCSWPSLCSVGPLEHPSSPLFLVGFVLLDL